MRAETAMRISPEFQLNQSGIIKCSVTLLFHYHSWQTTTAEEQMHLHEFRVRLLIDCMEKLLCELLHNIPDLKNTLNVPLVSRFLNRANQRRGIKNNLLEKSIKSLVRAFIQTNHNRVGVLFMGRVEYLNKTTRTS